MHQRCKQFFGTLLRPFMRTIIIVLLSILTVACVNPKKNEKLIAALNDTTINIRGSVIEVPNSDFRYDYYDVHEKDSHFKQLTDRGYQGGGPSWKGIVYGALKMSDPNILTKIRFDEEAEGLAIWCSDKETLEKIGRLVEVVKSDEKVLDECINVAEKGFEME
jgi:hypothetical protein